MLDIDIRNALNRDLALEHQSDPSTLILNELGLCQGDARVDIAVVNGMLTGYEIKSPADTLARLRGQAEIYNRTLDRVFIVAGESHVSNIEIMVPEWWGLQTIRVGDDGLTVVTLREPKDNTNVDPYALVQLLWRDEVLAILNDRGLGKGLQSKPRKILWNALAGALPLAELKDVVRGALKDRTRWRAD